LINVVFTQNFRVMRVLVSSLAFLSSQWLVVPSQLNVAISMSCVTQCWWDRTRAVRRLVITN